MLAFDGCLHNNSDMVTLLSQDEVNPGQGCMGTQLANRVDRLAPVMRSLI